MCTRHDTGVGCRHWHDQRQSRKIETTISSERKEAMSHRSEAKTCDAGDTRREMLCFTSETTYRERSRELPEVSLL